MSIGENIRKQRLGAGLTQKQLADLLHTSQSMIAQYETGKRIPKIENLSNIAHALGCSISDLDSEKKWDIYPRAYETADLANKLIFLREDFNISIDEASKILGIAPNVLLMLQDELIRLTEHETRTGK